jgi:hypothetical protein
MFIAMNNAERPSKDVKMFSRKTDIKLMVGKMEPARLQQEREERSYLGDICGPSACGFNFRRTGKTHSIREL